MQITYDPKLTRQNEDDQTVFFTITDDQGNEYEWHGDIPKDVDIQAHLEANVEKYLLLIRRREFPDCPGEKSIDLPTIEEWIKHNFKDIVKRVSWKSTHPRVSEIDMLKNRIRSLEGKVAAYISQAANDKIKVVEE